MFLVSWAPLQASPVNRSAPPPCRPTLPPPPRRAAPALPPCPCPAPPPPSFQLVSATKGAAVNVLQVGAVGTAQVHDGLVAQPHGVQGVGGSGLHAIGLAHWCWAFARQSKDPTEQAGAAKAAYAQPASQQAPCCMRPSPPASRTTPRHACSRHHHPPLPPPPRPPPPHTHTTLPSPTHHHFFAAASSSRCSFRSCGT